MSADGLIFFLNNIEIKDLFDLFLLFLIFYQVLKFSEKSGVYQVLVGLGVVALAFLVSEQLELIAVHSLLKNIFSNFFLVLVLLFQSEIRRGLTQLGSHNLFKEVETAQEAHINEEIAKAITGLSKKSIGALLVFENKIDLSSYSETGMPFHAEIKSEVIQALFHPSSQIHDGALVIKSGVITSVGAFLPLSTNPALDKNLGTRHRAALGIAELTDAKVVVVSEESQKIAFVEEGRLFYLQDRNNVLNELRTFLTHKKKGAL